MAKLKKELSFLIAGSLLFNYLFWEEDFGLNILLFTAFLVSCILTLFPSIRKSPQALIAICGTIITSVFVVLHSSAFVVIMYWLSALLMIGFIHQTELKSIAYAIPTALSNYLRFFGTFYKDLNQQGKHSNKISGTFRFLKVIVIPIILLVIFYFLFKFGNPVFDAFSTAAFQKINNWFVHLFGFFPYPEFHSSALDFF